MGQIVQKKNVSIYLRCIQVAVAQMRSILLLSAEHIGL